MLSLSLKGVGRPTQIVELQKRRSTLEIMARVLAVALKGAGKTEIVYRSNLNFKQARKFLNFLLEKGLLTIDDSQRKKIYRTTRKGEAFTKRYIETLELVS